MSRPGLQTITNSPNQQLRDPHTASQFRMTEQVKVGIAQDDINNITLIFRKK